MWAAAAAAHIAAPGSARFPPAGRAAGAGAELAPKVQKFAPSPYVLQLLWLVVIGVINSAVSIYYYLRVVMAMYFRDAVDEFKPAASGVMTLILVLCALAIFEMGIMPGFWLGLVTG